MSEQTEMTKGFSVLEAILVVFVVAILGFGGWYVWQKNKNGNARPVDNSPQTSTSKNEDSNKQLDSSENGKYLVIEEWGVRLPLSEELRYDVEYGIFMIHSGGETAYFNSKELAAKSGPGGGCQLTETTDSWGQGVRGGTIAVTRYFNKADAVEGLQFQAGDHWYALGFSNGGACYEGDTGQEKGEFNSAMDDAIRHLETIQSQN